jgi:hypothetical protein
VRHLLAAGLAAAGLLALAAPTHAQEETAPQPWRFESRAIDYSTMLQSQHGGQGNTAEVPLSRAEMRVLVRVPGQPSSTLETTTDMVGSFVLEGPEPPPGATLEFFVAGEETEGGRPGYYGRPWPVDDGEAKVIPFYRVATQVPRGMMLGNVINIVSTVDRDLDNDNGTEDLVVQLRHTAMLHNRDFEVWLGDLSRNDFSSFGIRIPEGFELRNVTVNNQAVDATDIGRSGHSSTDKWLYRQPIFPAFDGPIVFQAMFVAPYEEGRTYDVSWHNELPVMSYTLNLEQGRFTYLPPETQEQGHALHDAGMNPAMGNIQLVTHSFKLEQIPPHQTMSAQFMTGTPFPWKAVVWTGAILLIAAGAGLLGYVASRSRETNDAEVAQAKKRAKVPVTEEGREHELEMLERRLRRGEITSVEYDVRKAAIEKAQAGAPARTAPVPPSPPKRPGTDVAAIAARVDAASADQLRDDVRALLSEVRKLSGER